MPGFDVFSPFLPQPIDVEDLVRKLPGIIYSPNVLVFQVEELIRACPSEQLTLDDYVKLTMQQFAAAEADIPRVLTGADMNRLEDMVERQTEECCRFFCDRDKNAQVVRGLLAAAPEMLEQQARARFANTATEVLQQAQAASCVSAELQLHFRPLETHLLEVSLGRPSMDELEGMCTTTADFVVQLDYEKIAQKIYGEVFPEQVVTAASLEDGPDGTLQVRAWSLNVGVGLYLKELPPLTDQRKIGEGLAQFFGQLCTANQVPEPLTVVEPEEDGEDEQEGLAIPGVASDEYLMEEDKEDYSSGEI